ncbi:MAG: helix-turn-helix domain-containing protein [Candidatus Hermodarchaeota archaeon]
MKHYVAIGEASIMLGVCRTTIRRWDAAGHIQWYRPPGGHRRISLVEIERILNEDIKEDLKGTDGPEALKGSKTAIYARVSSHDLVPQRNHPSYDNSSR